jgi:RHS repeat-associated protein
MMIAKAHQDFKKRMDRRRLRSTLLIAVMLFSMPLAGWSDSLGTWPRINVGTPANTYINGIAYGNGTWVAVGQKGFITTSTDAKTWTKRSAGITRDFNDVTFSMGRFIAVCKAPDTGTGAKIWISDDNGASWKYRNSGSTNDYISVGLHGVAGDGNGNLVAVSGWPGRITRSADNGNTWHAWTNSTGKHLYGIGYGKGMWIATVNGNGIYGSGDGGESWTSVSTTKGATHVAFGNNRFVLAGNDQVVWSSDGESWSNATINGSSTYFNGARGCVFSDGLFVVVGGYGDIWTSETGRDFKQWRAYAASPSDPDPVCVGAGKGIFIAGGYDFKLKYGTAWISPSWLRARTGSTWDYPYTAFDSEEGLPKKIGLPEYRINTASLNLVLESTLFYMQTLSAPVNMRLVYNSAPTADDATTIGLFGKNWRFRYESVIGAFGAEAKVITGGGRSYLYTTTNGQDLSTATLSNPITLAPPEGVFDELKFYGTGQYFELKEKSSKMTYQYAVSGGAGNAIWRMTRITDRNGKQITLNVDGATGQIESITDPAGRAVTFSYDPTKNLCTGITMPDGRSATFGYDTHKNLTSIRDMAGYLGTYTYDTNGFLLTMNTAGRRNTFTYKDRPGFEAGTGDPENAGDKVVSSVINLAGTTKYELLTNNAGMKRTDTKGGVTIFASTEGQTAKITDPLGKISQMAYNSAKLPESFTDSNGKITSFDYDDRGNLVSTKDALGNKTTMTYDSRDNLISRKNAMDQTWTYTYDSANRVESAQTPLMNATWFSYFGNGRLEYIRDARGNDTTFLYDPYGNMTHVTDPLSNFTQFSYDTKGLRCTSIIDPRGKVKSMEYDDNDRLTAVRYDSVGGTPQRINTFDAFGQVSLTDELGEVVSVTRNEFGYITSVTDPLGNITSTDYDPNNNPVKVTDALGFATTTTYDSANRPLVLTDAMGKTVKREYDSDGNLLSLIDKNNNKTTYKYDANNRLIETKDPLSKTVVRNLDSLGRVSTVVNARGQIIRYSYDADGRVLKKEYKETAAGSFVQKAASTYDPNGNVMSRTDDWGVTAFTYDSRNQPLTIIYPTSNAVSFTYTAAGQLESITYPTGLKVNYAYDDFNRLPVPARFRNAAGTELYGNAERPNNVTRLAMALSGTTNTMNFAYDKAGNRVGDTRTNNTGTVYAYDAAQRVTNVLHQAGTNTLLRCDLAYNPVGSVTKEVSSGSAQLLPELPASAVTTYNACNQVISRAGRAYTYDADGNLTAIAGGEFAATYTPENRPSQIIRKQGATNETIQYTYDANGLRVKRAVAGGATNQFHYGPSDQLLFTTDGSGNVIASYVWKGATLVAVITGNSLSTDIFYPHLNNLGSVMALTDSAGTPVVKYAYQPYGFTYRETVPPGGVNSNLFTFAGGLGVQDEGGGLFYMKNRFYDSNTGRFLQRDPIGFEGGVNLYAYVNGNPVNRADPSGLLNMDGDHVDRYLANATGGGPGTDMALDLSAKVFHKTVKEYALKTPGKIVYDAARGKSASDIAVSILIKSPIKTFIMTSFGFTSGGSSIVIGLAIDAAEPAVTSAVTSAAEYTQAAAQETYQKVENAVAETEFFQQAAEANDPMNWIPQF